MRVLITFLLFTLFTVSIQAQMELLPNSFGSITDSNVSGNTNDIGITNMTEKMIDDWKTDADGNDINAILVVFFENMSTDDMKSVNISKLSNEKYVSFSDPELHDMSGKLAKWFYLPASSKQFDITFSHPRFGGARLIGVTMDKHKIYKTTLRANATVSLSINSVPSGATVYLDNKKVGVTPVTVPDTPMGKHTISLTTKDKAIADNLPPSIIDVSATSAIFDYNLLKKKDVTFVAKPSKAMLYLEKDGNVIAKGQYKISVDNLEYGTYKIKGELNGETSESMININDRTPANNVIEVIPSRSIAFTAIQNNGSVYGASINIDGEYIGNTPLTKSLNFGSYSVDMTYNGYHKKGKLNVNNNSDGRYELVLPNRFQSRHNPFNIDYHIREWGIAANYINRCYNFNVNGDVLPYTFWGEEGHESGFQIGLVYQPYFGYGQGLSTGLYWQYFWGRVDDDATYHEHSLYLPIQYQFRFPINENFSFFVNAGLGVNWGLDHSVSFDDYEESINVGYGSNEEYELYFPKAFNFSLLFGGGIQIGCIQVEAKFQRGLTDNNDMYYTDGTEKVSFKLNTWSIGVAYMF